MKRKYLKKNLKATKKLLKQLAYDYKLKMKWKIDKKRPLIWVEFRRKFDGDKYLKIMSLPEDKIAYGKYKSAMVIYNVRRPIETWLTKIYESVYGSAEENDHKVSKTHKKGH